MKCKYCGGEIPVKASKCPYCGSETQEKEKVYIDRPVMVYENEPEPDGLEYRKAKGLMYKNSALSFVLAVLSIILWLISSIKNAPMLLLPQIITGLFSLGIIVLTLPVCKRKKVKIIPFFYISIIIDVLSIGLLAFAVLK